MYSLQGLRRLLGLIRVKSVALTQTGSLINYSAAFSVLPSGLYKGDNNNNRQFSTSTITAYQNGSKRGLFPDVLTHFSCSSSYKNVYLPNQSLCATHSCNCLGVTCRPRHYCSKAEKNKDKDSDSKSLSIFQRFKQAYKQHGKVLVGVHVATSTVWLGGFYYLAQSGFDIVPLLESLRVSESILSSFKQSGLGDVASAYLMYKVATPARYTVTLAGTNIAIRYFRKTGRMEPVPESSRFRALYKDSKKYLSIRRKQLKKRQMAKMKKRLNKFDKFNKFNKFKKRAR